MKSQLNRIRSHLQRGRKITPLQALKLYGCFRLGARIYTLKRQGMNISSKMVEISTRSGRTYVKQYWKG